MNYSSYFLPFLISFFLGLLLTWILIKVIKRRGIVDRPETAPDRKIQAGPVPLLGGLAIFLVFGLVVLGYTFFTKRLLGGFLLPKQLAGFLIGGLFLMIGGFLDDKYHLKPLQQIIWPILASLTIIASGIGISYFNNPLGGAIYLDKIKWLVFTWNGLPYQLVFWADLFTIIWLLGMMYTTKFLDGLDGLVSGITVLGSLVIFLLSLNKIVAQPELALLAIILAGVSLGFLVFNWHPAKIFLGEGGSLFLGFMLGTLSILSGGKIATALLIMGLPILDVIWVVLRRLFFEKRSPFGPGDRKHLHFRLLDLGFSHRQAVLFLYLLTLIFGTSSLFFKGQEKLIAIIVLGLVMVILGVILVLGYRVKDNKKPNGRIDG